MIRFNMEKHFYSLSVKKQQDFDMKIANLNAIIEGLENGNDKVKSVQDENVRLKDLIETLEYENNKIRRERDEHTSYRKKYMHLKKEMEETRKSKRIDEYAVSYLINQVASKQIMIEEAQDEVAKERKMKKDEIQKNEEMKIKLDNERRQAEQLSKRHTDIIDKISEDKWTLLNRIIKVEKREQEDVEYNNRFTGEDGATKTGAECSSHINEFRAEDEVNINEEGSEVKGDNDEETNKDDSEIGESRQQHSPRTRSQAINELERELRVLKYDIRTKCKSSCKLERVNCKQCKNLIDNIYNSMRDNHEVLSQQDYNNVFQLVFQYSP